MTTCKKVDNLKIKKGTSSKKKRGSETDRKIAESRGRKKDKKLELNLRKCNLDARAYQNNLIEVLDS